MLGLIREARAIEYSYNRLHHIGELREKRVKLNKINRAEVRICVLDDEGYDREPLQSLGFSHVERKTCFERIEDYDHFNIILCDVEGVGREYDQRRQGIAIAEQIKSVYPEKIILLYTGKNIESYGEVPRSIDGVVEKTKSSAELAEEIERYYCDSIDPVSVWLKIRGKMIEEGVSTKTIALVEDKYCRAILGNKDYIDFAEYKEIIDFKHIEKYIAVLTRIVKKLAGELL